MDADSPAMETKTPKKSADEYVLQATIDLETTGLSVKDDEPIQVTVRCRQFNVTKKTWHAPPGASAVFTSYIHSARPSHPKAQTAHKIDAAKIASAPTFPAVWAEIAKHLEANKRSPAQRVVVAGQNVEQYDLPMLVHSLKRHNVALKWKPEFKRLGITDVLDTLQWSKRKFPEEKKHALKEVYLRVTKTPMLREHDSDADTLACEAIIEGASVYPVGENVISIELWGKRLASPPKASSSDAAALARGMSLGGGASEIKVAAAVPMDQQEDVLTGMCDECGIAFSVFFGHACPCATLPGIDEPDAKRRRVQIGS